MKQSLIALVICMMSSGLFAAELSGSYESKCLTVGPEEGRFDLVDYFEVSGDHFKAPYTRYNSNDGTCGTALLSGSLEGSLNLGELSDNGTAMDQSIEKFNLTLHHQGVVDSFNTRKLCKFEGWKLETAVDLLDLDCTGVINFKRGDTFYTAFKLTHGDLFLGVGSEGHAGNSAEQRHVEFTTVPLHSK